MTHRQKSIFRQIRFFHVFHDFLNFKQNITGQRQTKNYKITISKSSKTGFFFEKKENDHHSRYQISEI